MNSNSDLNIDPLSSWLESQIRFLIDHAPVEDNQDKSVEIMPLAITEQNGYSYELLAVKVSLVPSFEQLFTDIELLARCRGISIESSLRIAHQLLTIVAGLNGLDDGLVVKREGELDKWVYWY